MVKVLFHFRRPCGYMYLKNLSKILLSILNPIYYMTCSSSDPGGEEVLPEKLGGGVRPYL